MQRGITEQYLENFLDEKYEALCKDLLSKKLENGNSLNYRENGLSFSTIFEELIFVCLYDEKSFKTLQDHICQVLFEMLKEIPDYEVNLLFLRPINTFGVSDFGLLKEKEHYIAKQILLLVNDTLLGYFSSISEKKYEAFNEKLIQGIKEFPFSGSLLGDDYNIQNYWEEFCLITQDDGGLLNDLYFDTIFDYVKDEVKKLSNSELKILYSSSPDIWFDDYRNPFSDKDEMTEYITNKIFDMLRWKASNEYFEFGDEEEALVDEFETEDIN